MSHKKALIFLQDGYVGAFFVIVFDSENAACYNPGDTVNHKREWGDTNERTD